jgi:hypothetical protein
MFNQQGMKISFIYGSLTAKFAATAIGMSSDVLWFCGDLHLVARLDVKEIAHHADRALTNVQHQTPKLAYEPGTTSYGGEDELIDPGRGRDRHVLRQPVFGSLLRDVSPAHSLFLSVFLSTGGTHHVYMTTLLFGWRNDF